MPGRKLEKKAAEKKDDIRKKYRKQLEALGESIEDVKARLSRLISSDGDTKLERRRGMEEIFEDLLEKLRIRR